MIRVLSLLLLSIGISLNAAEEVIKETVTKHERQVPIISKNSSDEEIARFYEAFNGVFEAWFLYYFKTNDEQYFKKFDRDYTKIIQEVTSLQETDQKKEMFSKLIELSDEGIELIRQVPSDCVFGNTNEIIQKNNAFDIKIMKEAGINRALRILHSIKVSITYSPKPSGVDICEIYTKNGYEDAVTITKEMLKTCYIMEKSIFQFTRQHADIFNQIANSKDLTIFNSLQYLEFLIAFKKDYMKFVDLVLNIEACGKQLSADFLEFAQRYMETNNIEPMKIYTNFSYNLKSHEKTFDETKEDWIKSMVLKQL